MRLWTLAVCGWTVLWPKGEFFPPLQCDAATLAKFPFRAGLTNHGQAYIMKWYNYYQRRTRLHGEKEGSYVLCRKST